MIVWLLVVLTVVCVTFYRQRRRRLYELAAKIPCLKDELPLIGIAHRLIGNTEHIMSSLQNFSYECMQMGGISRSSLGHLLYVTIIDPADMEKVLKSCLEKDDLHRFIRKIIGNGLIIAPVSIWRRRRKVMLPALGPKIVESFIEIFGQQTNKLARQLEPFCGSGQFSVWPFVNRYTLDSICESSLGVKVNSQNNPEVPFLTALNRVTNLASERIFHLWLQPDCLYKLFYEKYTEHEKCRKTMRVFLDEIISKKRRELEENENNKYKANYSVLDNYFERTFLELLIQLSGGEKGYTDVELREEILTLIIAGTDTSAVAISNTLVLLAKYPKIQEKVHLELSNIFKDPEPPIVKEDLPKLEYLERVIKESLRLYPPAPFLVRKITKETSLPSGYILPAGSGVVISIWGVQRDPKYWGPDAECFDPDRFLPERFNLPHPCCYIPFSNGPRNCPGYQYAMMSMKAALSSILRRYAAVGEPEQGPVPKINFEMDLMMKAVDGYQLTLEKR